MIEGEGEMGRMGTEGRGKGNGCFETEVVVGASQREGRGWFRNAK